MSDKFQNTLKRSARRAQRAQNKKNALFIGVLRIKIDTTKHCTYFISKLTSPFFGGFAAKKGGKGVRGLRPRPPF